MNNFDYNKYLADMRKNKARIKQLSPNIKDDTGIYVLAREENGIRFGYIGKAQKQGIVTRLAQHLSGYEQWIDKSIKKHGLYNVDNPSGWQVSTYKYCEPSECDELEREFIRIYANWGYQLRNIESGGTAGKTDINERKPSKGYYDGLKQGAANLSKELQKTLKYLVIAPKDENKRTIRMYNKFWDLLTPTDKGENDDG